MPQKPSRKITNTIIGLSLIATSQIALAEKIPTQAQMWQIIQQQQKQIQALQNRLGMAEKKQTQTDQKIEATGDLIETQLTQTQSGAPGWWQNTQIGGYGELHYNGGKKDEIDFHRFVLFISHDFTEDIRLITEIEFEHSVAGEGKEGEVELEQAYLEFDLNENHTAKTGLFLLPVGIMNETHEPNTFFGTERNPVEKNIIPTTWWEAGAGISGKLAKGFGYDFAIHSGLDTPTTGSKAFKIRDGRQKVSKAKAENFAATARLTWQGIPGVKLGATVQRQEDITQGDVTLNEEISATLIEANANIRKGPVGVKALYAKWDLNGNAPEAIGRDKQKGWYIEPAYYINEKIGIFGRYSKYDNEAGNSDNTEHKQKDLGINYWPHQNVVLKADYTWLDEPDSEDDDKLLNLGAGFHF